MSHPILFVHLVSNLCIFRIPMLIHGFLAVMSFNFKMKCVRVGSCSHTPKNLWFFNLFVNPLKIVVWIIDIDVSSLSMVWMYLFSNNLTVTNLYVSAISNTIKLVKMSSCLTAAFYTLTIVCVR